MPLCSPLIGSVCDMGVNVRTRKFTDEKINVVNQFV